MASLLVSSFDRGSVLCTGNSSDGFQAVEVQIGRLCFLVDLRIDGVTRSTCIILFTSQCHFYLLL